MNEDVWVVIPAHNEEKHIKHLVLKVKQYCSNLVVVDDGSDDQTNKLSQDSGAIVLNHIINLGKGSALKTGCDYAYKKGAQKIIVMDADGQHNPELIPLFIKNLKEVDIVFGYRVINKKMPHLFRFGNWFINKLTWFLYQINLKDTQSGYRAFKANIYKKIRWQSGDYSMESEMISKVGKHKLKYKQIPIETVYLDKYKGTTVLDGIKIVWNMFFWRLK